MSKPTSVRLSDENAEYVAEMGISPSTYINQKLDEDRAYAGLTRREQLERELAEAREERSRKQRAVDELEDSVAELEEKLSDYKGTVDQELDDAIEGLHWLTRVHPELRGSKEHMDVVIRKTGFRHSLLVDLCNEVDIHYGELMAPQYEDLESRGIGFDEREDHEMYDAEAGEELTTEEEEQVREWLRANL